MEIQEKLQHYEGLVKLQSRPIPNKDEILRVIKKTNLLLRAGSFEAVAYNFGILHCLLLIAGILKHEETVEDANEVFHNFR